MLTTRGSRIFTACAVALALAPASLLAANTRADAAVLLAAGADDTGTNGLKLRGNGTVDDTQPGGASRSTTPAAGRERAEHTGGVRSERTERAEHAAGDRSEKVERSSGGDRSERVEHGGGGGGGGGNR